MQSALLLALGGCSGDDGKDGTAGPPGGDGISCWDLNGNGVADAEEDTNGDGVVDVLDCQLPPSTGDAAGLHKAYFTDREYEGTASCLACHGEIGDDLLTTGQLERRPDARWNPPRIVVARYRAPALRHGRLFASP